VNRRRRLAGFELLSSSIIRTRRHVVRPFEWPSVDLLAVRTGNSSASMGSEVWLDRGKRKRTRNIAPPLPYGPRRR
jgi:hypothetical protein